MASRRKRVRNLIEHSRNLLRPKHITPKTREMRAKLKALGREITSELRKRSGSRFARVHVMAIGSIAKGYAGK